MTTMERLRNWAADWLTTGFALGVVAVALVLFCIWALFDLFTQPDEKL